MFFAPKSFLPIKYSKTIRLYSTLNFEDCFVRLTKNIPQSSIAVRFGVGSHLIRGEVGVSSFWITRNMMDRNSWRVTLTGKLISDGNDTSIIGQFSMFNWVEPFMSCMMIFLLLFFLLFLLLSLSDVLWGRFQGNWIGGLQQYLPFLIIYTLFLIFAHAFQLAGRNSMEDDEKYLIQFLEKTLNAKQVE